MPLHYSARSKIVRHSTQRCGELGLHRFFIETDPRIEAVIFVAFLAYCLHVTLQQCLRTLALGLIAWRGWHAARRGLGTNLYRLGVPEKTIQAILRHAMNQ